MDIHDIKDLAMIYNDCDDYRVKIWSPEYLREGTLVFTGSSNPDKTIHFNVEFGYDGFVAQKAFKSTLEQIVDSGFDMSINWEHVYTRELVKYISESKDGVRES